MSVYKKCSAVLFVIAVLTYGERSARADDGSTYWECEQDQCFAASTSAVECVWDDMIGSVGYARPCYPNFGYHYEHNMYTFSNDFCAESAFPEVITWAVTNFNCDDTFSPENGIDNDLEVPHDPGHNSVGSMRCEWHDESC